MKMIKRMKNIINSNINAKLDKFEDPEKMIRYMMMPWLLSPNPGERRFHRCNEN